ncbi:lpg1689 family Dot/Icm T4SS effector [Legionella spiritensis]|uniref:23, 7 kDa protein n=1 Tax=Legionella spiritensis TaxID=452 RepID=A0A0W0Z8E7_LEGSP|nr:hypothetical protein [Legionella spiritensis]KTD65219.1 23, 7 kDa protein [Legionella spiritensis]SNV39692.1 Integral membrane protein (PIN domain superfamily) [Legionella spiritensis]
MITFFQSEQRAKQQSIENARKIMARVKNKRLTPYQEHEHFHSLLLLLNEREAAFESQIARLDGESSRQAFTAGYYEFAKTVEYCLLRPQQCSDYIESYFDSSDYIATGGPDGDYSHTIYDDIATGILTASVVMMTIGGFALLFNPLAAIIILTIGATFAAPSLYYHYAETRPNESAIQKEEKTLFQELETVINPMKTTCGMEVMEDMPTGNSPILC